MKTNLTFNDTLRTVPCASEQVTYGRSRRWMAMVLQCALLYALHSDAKCANAPVWQKLASKDPSAVEAAGGLAAKGGLWSAADVQQEGCDYRFQIWQGVPPFGAPSVPTQADYGDGAKPTYLRFETRTGMRPGPQSVPFDPKFDEWEGDYKRGDRDSQGRIRIERSLNREGVRVTGPSDATYSYEVSFYLEPGWAGAYLGKQPQKTKVAIAQLPFAGDHPVSPTSIFVTTGSDKGKKITVQSDIIGKDHWNDDLEKYVGRWVNVRISYVFQKNEKGRYQLFVDGKPVRDLKNVTTWKTDSAYMKYGLYLTKTKDVPASAFHDPNENRRTVVWFTGLRFSRE